MQVVPLTQRGHHHRMCLLGVQTLSEVPSTGLSRFSRKLT